MYEAVYPYINNLGKKKKNFFMSFHKTNESNSGIGLGSTIKQVI